MTHYLLDTNHLSPLVTEGHPLRYKILERMQNGDDFAIPVPALSEFLFGIQLLPRVNQNLETWALLADRFTYYNIERSDAEDAAVLRVLLRKQGQQLALVDAFIAVLAIRYNLVLLTRDADFTAVPHLHHQSWW